MAFAVKRFDGSGKYVLDKDEKVENDMDTQLRRLQLVQLEILKVIDKLCREHGIAYSLYAGTLLGAVRHKGFIPWDDDLDICMSRAEYEHFLKVWEAEKPQGYLLQNKENTQVFTQSFSKVRKEHTCFLQYDWERGRYHTGIFVDVFPIDRLPSEPLEKRLFQWNCLKYLLFTREFVPPKGSFLQKTVSGSLLAVVPRKRRAGYRERLLKRIKRYNDRNDLPCVGTETLREVGRNLPVDFMSRFVDLPFEDGSFMCSAVWEQYLTAKFGNYMQLPPESERAWKHHPIILNFERDYEEIQKEKSNTNS